MKTKGIAFSLAETNVMQRLSNQKTLQSHNQVKNKKGPDKETYHVIKEKESC